MDSLPLDLLAYCLGYVSLSDIHSCWLVCKRFKDAITTKKHFWKRNIQLFLESKGCKNYHFDPFVCVDKKETLQEQVSFLFRRGWFRFKSSKISINIYKRSNQIQVLCLIITMKNMSIQYTKFESTTFEFSEFTVKTVLLHNGQKQFFNSGGLYAIEGLQYPDKIWNGNVIKGKSDSSWSAHGKGEWIFPDGTILRGEYVAQNGTPVMLVDYEKWKKYKEFL
jgi:hypothetical protein